MTEAQLTPKRPQGCIVIIDDVPDNLQLLTRTLRQHGYQIRAAATGAMGLETIRAELPDLILLDLMLPDMDGYFVCQQLKEQPETAKVPVIFLTARNQTSDIVRAFGAGGVDYVSKPFQMEELLARIDTHLRLRWAELDRAQIERRLHETQKLESLAVLAGGIAHDFNNLLTVIQGNAELAGQHLSAEGFSEQDRGMLSPLLEQIESASHRASGLCAQMLAYSGRSRFRLDNLDLSALVRDLADLLRHTIPARASLRLQLDPKLPPLLGDAAQIRQFLTNLVHNAGEALRQGAGVITITTSSRHADKSELAAGYLSPDLPEGEYVRVEIRDDGHGMTPEVVARVFDPFFTTKFVGRGLGLAAVLGIVRGHLGAIQVESTPGVGSCFRVLLPAGTSTAPVVSTSPANLPASERPEQGAVLVVDDEEAVRGVTGRILEHAGFRVLLANSGREALHQLQSGQAIGLVLLDLTMPEMDGAETFQEIHRLHPDVPVILLSGFSEAEATSRVNSPGLAGFLKKPYQGSELIARVKSVLGARG
jgi:two-component system, cell cycle sensor histidine kinase and response regulator CckA